MRPDPENRVYPRVKELWELEKHDIVGFFAARDQYIRDQMIEYMTTVIFGEKLQRCVLRHGVNAKEKCKPLKNAYNYRLLFAHAPPWYHRSNFQKPNSSSSSSPLEPGEKIN